MVIIVNFTAKIISKPVFIILAVGLIFRSIIALWLFLGCDEGYYYLYTQHLDWSYFDHPILVGLVTAFGPMLTGVTTPFTLRLGSLLLYTGSLYLLYCTSKRLFDHGTAFLTLIMTSICPIFVLGFGVLTLPDSPLVFWWTATLYCAVYEFFPDHPPYVPSNHLMGLGVFLGLACLGKYHGFVLVLGLLGFCFTSKAHRSALYSPKTLGGVLLFLVTLFPLWYWNAQHNWISFKFQLFQRFDSVTSVSLPPTYNLFNVLGTFGMGVFLLFPTLGLPLWWTSFKTLIIQGKIQPSLAIANKPYFREKLWFIVLISVPLMVGFTLLGGKQQILPTWPMPGFWSASLLLGFYANHWQQQNRRWVRWWLQGTTMVVSSLLLIMLTHLQTGILFPLSQSPILDLLLTSENQAKNQLIDVAQFRQKFSQSPQLITALQNSAFIFSNAYYLSGLIGLALHPLQPIPITCLSDDRRGFAYWPSTEQWIGQNGLYITLKLFRDMPTLTQEFRQFFQSLEEIGKIELEIRGIKVDTFYVYYGQNLLRPYVFNPHEMSDNILRKERSF